VIPFLKDARIMLDLVNSLSDIGRSLQMVSLLESYIDPARQSKYDHETGGVLIMVMLDPDTGYRRSHNDDENALAGQI
jgi:hypothetical protein